MFIYPVWNPSNISRVFVKRHNFKLMITKIIQGCLISTPLHIDIPYIVRSLFTLRKCWSVQMIGVPCVSKSNMQRFCMNYDHPAKPQLHRRPRTWVEARLNRSVYPLLFFASLQSSPRRMKKACREKMIKITFLG